MDASCTVSRSQNEDFTTLSLQSVVSAIANRAAGLDEAGTFPAADIDELRRAGLLCLFARPVETDALNLTRTLRSIGTANLSVGRIFEGHVNAAKLVTWYGSPAQNMQLKADIGAGHIFAVWATEAAPGVAMHRDGDGWRLEGAKSFATGAGHVDSALITARLSDKHKQLLWMRLSDEEAAMTLLLGECAACGRP